MNDITKVLDELFNQFLTGDNKDKLVNSLCRLLEAQALVLISQSNKMQVELRLQEQLLNEKEETEKQLVKRSRITNVHAPYGNCPICGKGCSIRKRDATIGIITTCPNGHEFKPAE